MKIDKGSFINDFIDKNLRQYLIPVYQRNYAWSSEQCKKLFEDIIQAYRLDRDHFTGSVVYELMKTENKIDYYIIIDSTVNNILERHCKAVNVPIISVHGLRHTHASLLLFAGVSIASVARRLGHASMNTTQKTYLHIIQELENQDIDLVMRSLSGLS